MGVEASMMASKNVLLMVVLVAAAFLITWSSSEEDKPSWGSNEPGGPSHHVSSGACKVRPTARKDCNQNHRDECIKAGCCWAPNQEKCASDEICPWCFHPTGHDEV